MVTCFLAASESFFGCLFVVCMIVLRVVAYFGNLLGRLTGDLEEQLRKESCYRVNWCLWYQLRSPVDIYIEQQPLENRTSRCIVGYDH